MATTIGGGTASERTVVREILHSVAEKTMQRKNAEITFQAVPREEIHGARGWLEFVTGEIASLPWYETNLPDGRTPPQPRAAVELVSLLAAALNADTIAPSSVNTTWAGGVAVEWHLGGMDLEIACQPDGTAEFSFEDSMGEESEGPVTDDMTQLRQLVARLPSTRQRAE